LRSKIRLQLEATPNYLDHQNARRRIPSRAPEHIVSGRLRGLRVSDEPKGRKHVAEPFEIALGVGPGFS
jgi:hypothetical protein